MEPIDFRNQTFEDLQEKLQGQRVRVWEAWRQHGPCTTRQLAARSGMDILSVRPRTTELCQLGLIVVSGAGHEGIYRALSDGEVRAIFEAARREVFAEQKEFSL